MVQWATVTTFRNSICWVVVQHLDSATSKSIDSSLSPGWGSEAAEDMGNQVRQFQIPGGKASNLTMGDIIDRTPKDRISKVMLEEKIFSTWHGGRTVLLGDGITETFAFFVIRYFSPHQLLTPLFFIYGPMLTVAIR